MGFFDRLAGALFPASTPAPTPSVGAQPPLPTPRPTRAKPIAEGLYKHYSDFTDWPFDRWKNFTPRSVACRHCGELFIHVASLDRIQKARDIFGGPLVLNCGHRCIIHNAHVGGAPMSEHKRIAFDVSVRGKDRFAVYAALRKAGFSTFGFYETFIHTDVRPGRSWYSSKKAKALWAQ